MAFSIGAISANVTADDSGFSATMNNVHRQGEQVSSSVAQQFQKVGDSFVSAGKKLTTRVTAPLTALAGLSVKAFDTQIQAEKRLESALAATGEEVRSNMKDFKEFASGLQEITTVGDESTLQMIQTAKSMGLTNDQAKRAAKNSIALAKAMGMNEQSAIRYAAALEQGQVTMLSRYLPGLREIEDMSERAAKAQELLSDMFGAATSEAQAGLGPLKQIKNTLGDFSEEVGEIVLNRMQPLIDDLRSTVNWFKNLDQQSKELIVTVGGLAAAIGPAALGLGWAIKLTIPAVKTLTKSVRVLTGAMMANPYLAVAAAIAAIGTKAYFTEKAIERFHDEVKNTLNTADDWQTVNKQIAKVEDRMNELADAAAMVGVSPEQNKEFVELRKQLERLVDMRDRLTREEVQFEMQMDAVEDARELMAFINTDLTKIKITSAGIGSEWMALNGAAVKVKETVDKIFESSILAKQGIQEMTSQDIINSPVANLPEKMFPPGSLGFLQQSLANIKEQLRKATDPDVIQRLQQKIAELNGEIQDFGDDAEESTRNADMAMGSLGNSIGNVVGQIISGKEEALSFGNILSTIAPALINVLTGGAGGFGASLLSGAFGGAFHSGGVVPGSGEKMALVKGGETIFTKGQMKAMGGLLQNGGGGSMDTGKMQKAFERALGNKLQKLGPEEMYLLSRKGQHSF